MHSYTYMLMLISCFAKCSYSPRAPTHRRVRVKPRNVVQNGLPNTTATTLYPSSHFINTAN